MEEECQKMNPFAIAVLFFLSFVFLLPFVHFLFVFERKCVTKGRMTKEKEEYSYQTIPAAEISIFFLFPPKLGLVWEKYYSLSRSRPMKRIENRPWEWATYPWTSDKYLATGKYLDVQESLTKVSSSATLPWRSNRYNLWWPSREKMKSQMNES